MRYYKYPFSNIDSLIESALALIEVYEEELQRDDVKDREFFQERLESAYDELERYVEFKRLEYVESKRLGRKFGLRYDIVTM